MMCAYRGPGSCVGEGVSRREVSAWREVFSGVAACHGRCSGLLVGCAGRSLVVAAVVALQGGSCCSVDQTAVLKGVIRVAGPIDFASDGPRDAKGPTEFGGRAGLIQRVEDGHVEMSATEKRGVLVRAEPAKVVDELTGLYEFDEAATAIDPVSGRGVDPEWNEDGSTGSAPVDAPPKTENP